MTKSKKKTVKVKNTKNNQVIRLWKLGDHKEGIMPTKKAIDKLAKILEKVHKDGKGDVDIIWDSLIEVQTIGGNENSTTI